MPFAPTRRIVSALGLGLAPWMSGAHAQSEGPRLRFVVREADGTAVPRAECFLVATLPGEAPYSSVQWADEKGERDWFLDEHERALLARDARFELVVPLPIGSETRRAFDPLEGERVELHLAASGKLDLVLCDEHGQPLEAGVAFHFRLGEAERGADGDRFPAPRSLLVEAPNGRVRTPPMALGKSFRVAVALGDGSRPVRELRCEGPRERGEIRTCLLRAAPPHPRLELRFCDASGAPLADEWIGLRFHGRHSPAARPSQRTGPRGELRVLLDPEVIFLPPAASRAGDATFLELWTPPVHPRWRARLELTPERLERGGELGELRAEALEVGVRGVLVDRTGKPLPERGVAVAEEPAAGGEPWDWELLRTTSDAEGRFELRVPADIDRVRLRVVNAHDAASTTSQVQLELFALEPRLPHNLALRLVLPARGEIVGRMLLDDLRHALGLEILLEDARGELRRMQSLGSSGSPPGHFALGELVAGERFTLRIGLPMPRVTPRAEGAGFHLEHHARAGLFELCALEPLALPSSGGPCEDPRLRAIDLRGALVMREVQVLDSAERPLAREALHIAQRARDGALRSIRAPTDAEGRARWLGPSGEHELWLGKMGHALVALDGRVLQQTARLSAEPPHALELLLEDPAPVLPEHVRLTLHLRCYEVPELWVAAGGDDISDHEAEVRAGLARFALSYPGTYHIGWRLEAQRGGRSEILWQDDAETAKVVVSDRPGLQRQSLRWPREEIAQALRRAPRGG